MKTPTFLLAAMALALLSGCATTAEEPSASAEAEVNGVPIGQIRGVVDVSATLRVRLLDDTDPRAAGFDVSRLAGRSAFTLRRQLGTFVQAGTATSYQGGTPTPFGMMLWHQLFGRFTAAVGETCESGEATIRLPAYVVGGDTTTGQSFRLAPSVADWVAAACTFEGDESTRRATASTLWDAVMGVGGSLAEERAAFVEEVSRPGAPLGRDQATGRVRVTGMLLMMLLNPHFMLNK